LVIVLAFFLCACVAAGKKEYDVGMQLNSAGKYKEAIAYLNQAIAKEPDNEEYKTALAQIKETQINKFVKEGNQALGSQSPITLSAINRANDKLALARDIDAGSPSVKQLEAAIGQQKRALMSEVKALYDKAKGYIAAEDWLKAYFSLQQIQGRYPNYEDTYQLMNRVSSQGSSAFFAKAKADFDKEDYKAANENLRKALSLKSDSKPARQMMSTVRRRDNAEYFIGQGREAVTAQNWTRAAFAYQKALEYDPNNAELKKLTGHVRMKAGDYSIRTTKQLMDRGSLLKAFEMYYTACKHVGSPIKDPNDFKLNSLRKDLTVRAAYAAEQFKDQGKFGSAWFWYDKIKGIDPQFDKIFYLIQEMEDRIKQRVTKSIAVFDFSSPRDNQDAGIIVANNLITFLFNNASGDIKILERENLKSILEEMKLGQIGVVSSSSAKEMGRVYGIDVAIMGSVLLFKVDTTISHGTKSVRYKVGEKIEDNIEYLNWKAKHPDPDADQLATAPPAKIKIPEYAEKDYKVSNHKKVGFVQLSFRIVDVRTGENIQVRTIESKKVVEDDTSAGLPEAKVKFDDLTIETDTELLQQMTDEVVSELGREALRPLSNLERNYYRSAENMIRRRDPLQASENFVNAIFSEKLKQMQNSPMTEKALLNLDNIFREYRIAIGG
jgi:tetratricopeptide (TPR) repeat protein